MSPARDHVHAGVGQAGGEQPRVAQRNGRVLLARHDQGGPAQAVQPRQARPAGGGIELVGIAERVRRVREPGVRLLGQPPAIARRDPSGEVRQRQREQPRVVVARGRGEHQRRHRPWRHAAEAGAGGAQHEPPDPIRGAPRELLRERAAERVAEHVHALQRERVHQLAHDPGQLVHPQRQARSLREPDAGRVERHELAVAHQLGERRPHVQVGADARDQQQGRPGAGPGDAQAQSGDGDEGGVHPLVTANSPTRRSVIMRASVHDGRMSGHHAFRTIGTPAAPRPRASRSPRARDAGSPSRRTRSWT